MSDELRRQRQAFSLSAISSRHQLSPLTSHLSPLTNISARTLISNTNRHQHFCPHTSKDVCSYWNRGVAEGDLEHRNEGDVEVRKEGSR
jgi:hypothetical protein